MCGTLGNLQHVAYVMASPAGNPIPAFPSRLGKGRNNSADASLLRPSLEAEARGVLYGVDFVEGGFRSLFNVLIAKVEASR